MKIKIDDLLGVPYKDHGRDSSGYDCYGLAIEAARRFGYKLNDIVYENYDVSISEANAPTLNITKVDKPHAGELIEMMSGDELHVGICLNEREFIHETRAGCRVSGIGCLAIRGFYVINTRL